MNAPDQENLYEDYWLEIEKMLKPGTDYSNLNLFFMQYIVYKTSTPGNIEHLYDRFVKFYNIGKYTKESILQELKYYAAIFQAFVYNSERYSVQVRKLLRALRLLKQTTCYPFLLHIFHDFEQKIISEEALEKTLKLILTYLIRRAVCGVPTNSLRGLFTYLYNRVFKVETNKKKYYESINKFLHTVSSKDIFPSDSEFNRSLQEAKIYSNAPLCKFLLMDIENGDGKETLNAEELTIEHIMPQHLGVGWRHISEEEHEQYLHVLGNLSVTGYNSELSNKNFEEKKQFIIENSKAKTLNSDVWNQETWTVENIVQRGKRLAEQQPAEQSREDGFQTHQQGRQRGLHVALADDLKRVGHAAGEDARIDNGPPALQDRSPVRRFEQKHADRGQRGADQKLHAAQPDAVHMRHDRADIADVERKQHRAAERQQIAARDRKAGANAQQIHAAHCSQRAQPDLHPGPLAHDRAQDGDEHDVKRRYKAGFSDRRVKKPELLQRRRCEQQYAADRAGQQLLFLLRPRDRPVLRPALPVEHGNDWKQHEPCQEKPRRAHRKRFNILHALALGDERRAPDHGAQEKKNTALCLLAHCLCPFIVKKNPSNHSISRGQSQTILPRAAICGMIHKKGRADAYGTVISAGAAQL